MITLDVLTDRLFRAPYRWLPAAVFGFFVVCFALHPESPFYTHHLADPDDYMRLNEVISWLQGQPFRDLSVPRLSPGAGTIIHWSRLVDAPIALVALPFVSSLGVTQAVFIASLLVPLAWFAVMLDLVPRLARPFLGKEHAKLSSVFILFSPLILFNFAPGRVDHHGVQLIIAGFGLLSFARILTNDRATTYAVGAAVVFACGFWIGAESLPWVLLFISCLLFGCVFGPPSVARHAVLFGAALATSTWLLVLLALSPNEYTSRALSWFSPAYGILASLLALIFLINRCIGSLTDKKRLKAALALATAFGGAVSFFYYVPGALHGPFTDYDLFDASTALDSIVEAQPLARALVHVNRFMPATFLTPILLFSRWLFLPILALAVSLWSAKHTKDTTRFLWCAQSVYLLTSIGLTMFWQMRVGLFMEVFALVPLTRLLYGWWAWLKWGLWGRSLYWAEIGVFLLLGFLPVVLIPAFFTHTTVYPDLVLFPAARAAAGCALEPLVPFLTDRAGLGASS